MYSMVVTRDTSQLEISPLNSSVPETTSKSNKLFISVTPDTSQDPVGPCGPLEQSLDSFRQYTIAAKSSAFDFTVHPVARDQYRVRQFELG